MDSNQGSSFIPKSPVRGTVKKRGVRKVYIFTYLIFIFFFGTMIASAVTFAYDFTVNAQLAQAKQTLLDERTSFSQSNFEQVRELDVRTKTAYSLFSNHVSVLHVLSSLEASTLAAVQLTGFSFTKDLEESEEGSHTLVLNAKMSDFNAALFQREMFTGDSVLNGARLSEVTLTDTSVIEESADAAEVTFVIEKVLTVADIPYTPSVYAVPEVVAEIVPLELPDAVDLGASEVPAVVNEEL